MLELIITRGLPASGKSTWARSWAADDPEHRIRVNRDDLRMSLHGRPFYTYEAEKSITVAEKAMAEAALKSGRSVVADAMNLKSKYVREWAKLGHKYGATVRVEDFEQPLDVLVGRDIGRVPTVGEKFIRDTAARYGIKAAGVLPAAPDLTADPVLTPEPVVHNEELRKAIIVDLDGTLALHNRSPYDYSLVSTDSLNTPIDDLIIYLDLHFNECSMGKRSLRTLLVSGRPDSCREDTEQWLKNQGIRYDALFMRRADDKRPDDQVKLEIFNTHIRDRYNVLWVLDDRDRVVAMWRRLGLTCLQVADGAF